MPALNKVQLIGNLGADPEMRYTPSGKPVTKFSLAVNYSWKGQDGEQKTQTEWINIEAWNRLAEICNQYLHKGSLVYIEGRLKTDKYTPEGSQEKKYFTKVTMQTMQMLDKKGDGQGGGNYQPQAGGSFQAGGNGPDFPPAHDDEPPPPDDDIPF